MIVVFIVKFELIEFEFFMKEVVRMWYFVVCMFGKCKSLKLFDLYEILVNLGFCVICILVFSCVSEDGNGNWWVFCS